jgi:hypothetical protein
MMIMMMMMAVMAMTVMMIVVIRTMKIVIHRVKLNYWSTEVHKYKMK